MFPPILLMINRYTATADVLTLLGISSTTMAKVMPIHISPENEKKNLHVYTKSYWLFICTNALHVLSTAELMLNKSFTASLERFVYFHFLIFLFLNHKLVLEFVTEY